LKYYTIGPLNHLDLVEKSQCHLVVAQHLTGKTFLFYKRLREQGKEIILDNGAFETGRSMDVNQYVLLANKLKPRIIVIPDIWKDMEGTLKVTADFLKLIKHRDKGYEPKFMFVPQGETIRDLVECFMIFMADWGNPKKINLIGLPYKQWEDTTGVFRRMLAKNLTDLDDVRFHLLGLYSLEEATLGKLIPRVVSCDSSLPFKAAMMGSLLSKDPTVYTNKFNFRVDFDGIKLRMAKMNLQTIEGAVL